MWRRWRTWLCCLVIASLTGCGAALGTIVEKTDDVLMYPFKEWVFLGAFKYDNPWDEPYQPLESRKDFGKAIVGITFSGGGSRSAYFSACVLEQLGRYTIPGTNRTFLEELDVVAGVSGGSLAATYYVANRRREGYPQKDKAFFARMRDDLSLDFEMRSIARGLLAYWPLLQFTYYDMGDLLAAVFDSNLLDDLTYGDLDPKGPILCATAVCYNNAQKFVFTNGRLTPFLSKRSKALGSTSAYTYGTVQTFETIGSSIARCPLSKGVQASSAVPGLIGRVVLEDKKTGRALYLGDGGVYDNSGAETLLQALEPLGRVQRDLPVYILVVDAAGVFRTDEDAGDVSTIAGFLDRTTEIAWLRAGALASHVFEEGILAAYKAGKLKQLPFAANISLYDEAAITKGTREKKVGSKLIELVRGVPTRYSISSDSIEAIEAAAPLAVEAAMKRLMNVHAERPAVLKLLRPEPTPAKPAEPPEPPK